MGEIMNKTKHPMEELFRSDSYSIEQPYFQVLEEGYTIRSQDGSEVYYAVRKRNWGKRVLAQLIGGIAALAALAPMGYFLWKELVSPDSAGYSILFSMMFMAAVGLGIYFFIYRAVAPKRKTTLSFDKNHKNPLFTIEPTSSAFIYHREYHLKDQKKKVMIVFKRPLFESIFRIRWHAYTPSGKYLFTAIEDNFFMAFLRRYLELGSLIPLHFHLCKNGGKKFAEFKRHLSLRDKYHLSHNPGVVPAWIVVATSILLDTGEER